ncbi:MAG: GAF domain-containing protein [Anaerolineae bacterium]
MLYPENSSGGYLGFIRLLPESIKAAFAVDETLPQAKNKQFRALLTLSKHITATLDLDSLLNDTVQTLTREFEYQFASIFLLNPDETSLKLKATTHTGVLAADVVNVAIDPQTIVGQAIVMAESLLAPDVSTSKYRPLQFLPSSPCSEVAVPLILAGQILGVLDIQNNPVYPYGPDDLTLLQTIADQLAVAIQNIRLFEERDRRMAELAVFNQIGAVIAGFHDLTVILPQILARVSALFQVEGVSLMLLEKGQLHFAATLGPVGEKVKLFSLKPGQGIAWSVIETGQTIKVDRVESDSRHFSEIDAALDFKTHSLLAVPVQIHGKILGVIEAINRLDGLPFSRDDEVTLEFIASSVAIAIENNRLFDQRQQHIERLGGLLEASRVISTLDVQEILDTIVQRAGDLLKAEQTVLYLADYERQQARAVTSYSRAGHSISETLFFKFKEGTIGWALEKQQPLLINDVTKDDRFLDIFPQSKFVRNLITVPLIVKTEAIGALETINKSDNAEFTPEDEVLLSAFANHAAIAIHNASLYEETNRRLAEVSTLYTLADQITRVADPNRAIEATINLVRRALDCSGCCLFLLEKREAVEELILWASDGWPEPASSASDLDYLTQLAQTLILKPQSIHIADIRKQASLAFVPTSTEQSPLQLRSLLIIPLLLKDKLLGALAVNDLQPHVFSPPEVEHLLTITGAQLSTAIENFKLYGNLEQRAKELETALAEVEEANRLRAEFVQHVSHELRTPLTFIRAYLDLMLEGALGDLSEPMQDKLRLLSQKSHAVIRLVEDIVSLQKVEAGYLKLSVISPLDLINYAWQSATANAAEFGITLVTAGAPDLPLVMADRDRIGQVFDNLIGNALRFSRPDSEIKIYAEADGPDIKFSVQDHGAGIPADELNRIFEKFYQVKQPAPPSQGYKGSGLGLAIVKQIIEAHHGRLAVTSELGQGSTFSFWLPVSREAQLN